jgi:hypothetical protein
MKYPELLFIPSFLLVDYYLTIAGAILIEKKYKLHFRMEHYELNPVWQEQVADKKWFNPKHLALTLLLTIVLVAVGELFNLPPNLVRGMTGFVFVFFGIAIGRHIANLLTFWQVTRHPEQISGVVTISHGLSLSISMYQVAVVLFPLLLVTLFSPAPFIIGALLATFFQVLIHLTWINQLNKRRGLS